MSYAYIETEDIISSAARYIENLFDNVETEIIGKRIKTHNPISWLLLFLGTSTVYDVNKSVYVIPKGFVEIESYVLVHSQM